MYVCVCAYFLLFFFSTFNKICGKWKPSAGKGISLPLRSYFTLPTSKGDAEKPWQAQDRAACSIRMPRPTASCPSPSLCRLRSARPGSASRPLFYVLQTSHTNNGNEMLAEPEPEPLTDSEPVLLPLPQAQREPGPHPWRLAVNGFIATPVQLADFALERISRQLERLP